MAKSPVSIIKVADNTKKLFNGVKFMKNNYVLIGVPQKETKREGEPVTNAELLFIHTNGSPINNIPARPVIEPALKNSADKISNTLKKSANFSISGDRGNALKELERAGLKGQNVSRDWFTNPLNNWPPNSPAVTARKIAKGSTNPKPLIDTGELIKSITYVVVREGKRTK